MTGHLAKHSSFGSLHTRCTNTPKKTPLAEMKCWTESNATDSLPFDHTKHTTVINLVSWDYYKERSSLPIAGLEPTFLPFWGERSNSDYGLLKWISQPTDLLTITPPRLPDVTIPPTMATVYLCSSSLPERSVLTTTTRASGIVSFTNSLRLFVCCFMS